MMVVYVVNRPFCRAVSWYSESGSFQIEQFRRNGIIVTTMTVKNHYIATIGPRTN